MEETSPRFDNIDHAVLDLAWSWPDRPDGTEKKLSAAMELPSVGSENLLEGMRIKEKHALQNRRRRRRVEVNDFTLASLAIAALNATEIKQESMISSLAGAVEAMDSRIQRKQTQVEGIEIAASLANKEYDSHRMYQLIAGMKHIQRDNPASIVQSLFLHGDTQVAQASALCAAIILLQDTSLSKVGFKPLHTLLEAPSMLSFLSDKQKNPQLFTILAASFISTAIESFESLPENLVSPLIHTIQGALPGARARQETPAALVALHAISALALLLQKKGGSSWTPLAADACLELLGCGKVDPVTRLVQTEALRFISLVFAQDSTSQNNHLEQLAKQHPKKGRRMSKHPTIKRIQESDQRLCVGALALLQAPEMRIRTKAVEYFFYMARSVPNAAFLAEKDFSARLLPLLTHLQSRGHILRLILIMARTGNCTTHMVDAGCLDALEKLVLHRAESTTLRSIALRALFALGHFELFTSGRFWKVCPARSDALAPEAKRLESLMELRLMQLAFQSRPPIEQSYTKRELFQYITLFDQAAASTQVADDSRHRSSSAVVHKIQMLPLLKDCCDANEDPATKKKLTKRSVEVICDHYDTDRNGLIDWSEFLNILFDLREGAFAEALLRDGV